MRQIIFFVLGTTLLSAGLGVCGYLAGERATTNTPVIHILFLRQLQAKAMELYLQLVHLTQTSRCYTTLTLKVAVYPQG